MKTLSRRLTAALVAALVVAGTVTGLAGAAAAKPPVASDLLGGADPIAPLLGTSEPSVLENRYIVVFRDGSSTAAVDSASSEVTKAGGRLHFRYGRAVHGFAATLSSRELTKLRDNPDVAYVEADRVVHATETTQTSPTWGLDRIDQHALPLNKKYLYTSKGTGVKAYVIDTGIRRTHTQFGGRAFAGFDAFGGNASDCNGHGTHVAGTIGGKTYGVAKGVILVSVRVLDCSGSGTLSGVVAGVNWVTANHTAGKPAVANMSLGGDASTTIDNAVAKSIKDGVTYAIAAGNDGANACNFSPARVSAAITVGATQSNDTRASFSNIGSCIDLFAPGVSIKSAWSTSDTATQVISGTSMATPHVAGTAALYLQTHKTASPATVRDALVNRSTKSVVRSPGSGSPNRLLYSRSL